MAGGLTYSRVVAWLRILLPLAALGILATLFLFARTEVDPEASIPFAEIELEERMSERRITAPHFAGETSRGDQVIFSAQTARPDPDDSARAIAKALDAQIDLIGGARVTFSSDEGFFDNSAQQMTLTHGVMVATSTGYQITTEELTASMRELFAESLSGIRASGPPGEIVAGSMQLRPDEASGDAYLVFKDGVRLIYQRQD